jgi:peptidyl-prolyl cis-trans isomerase C
MMFFRSLLLVCPAACLLAQTPPPPRPVQATPVQPQATPVQPQATPVRPQATPVPKPTVTLTAEDPNAKPMPVVPPDRVVISVGNEKITAAQFDQIIAAIPQQYQASARGAGRKQFADNLVRIMVLAQEGKRRKLDEGQMYKTQISFQNSNILAGITYDQIGKDTKIDDAELHKYYEAHKNEFEQVKARHILIRAKGSPLPVKPGQKDLTEEEALAKVQDLRKQIAGGKDFAALAQQESDDTGSGANGGDLGFFHRNQMVPAFETAAWALKPGELSEPVKTPFGYHLIRVEAHETKSFDEMKPEIEKRIRPDMAQKALDELQKQSGVQMDPEFFGTATPPPAPPAPAK